MSVAEKNEQVFVDHPLTDKLTLSQDDQLEGSVLGQRSAPKGAEIGCSNGVMNRVLHDRSTVTKILYVIDTSYICINKSYMCET